MSDNLVYLAVIRTTWRTGECSVSFEETKANTRQAALELAYDSWNGGSEVYSGLNQSADTPIAIMTMDPATGAIATLHNKAALDDLFTQWRDADRREVAETAKYGSYRQQVDRYYASTR